MLLRSVGRREERMFRGVFIFHSDQPGKGREVNVYLFHVDSQKQS